MSDNRTPLSPDDPRLSAYLLGELEPDEQSALEAELESRPELQHQLAELRETSSLISEALNQEPAPALSSGQRSAILSAAKAHSPHSKENSAMKKPNRRGTWAIVAAIAALGIVMAVVISSPEELLDRGKSVAVIDDSESMQEQRWSEAQKTPPNLSDEKSASDDPVPDVTFEYSSGKDRGRTSGGIGGGVRETEESAPRGEIPADPEKEVQLEKMQNEIGKRTNRSIQIHSDGQQAEAPQAPQLAESALKPAGKPAPGPPASGERKAVPPGQSVALSKSERGASSKLDALVRRKGIRSQRALLGEGEARWGLRKSDLKRNKQAWNLQFEGEAGEAGNEVYQPIFENDFVIPSGEKALSTFSIDVDTASYSNMRRFIQHGQRPPANAVRIEELVNYFHYDYAPPVNGDPFSVHTEVAICPWKPEHHLVRFGLKGREISKEQRPLSNLVFLVDVSGSMSNQNKLPLVKKALTMLVNEMNENDRISLVTYASSAAVRLPSTSGEYKSDILAAIDGLKAGGSTNGEGGIHLAYTQAVGNYIEDGSNRVILCTDGDFNVGVSDDDQLVELIQDKAKNSGVFLSIFGFGMGNYKGGKLEKLSNKGNGNYAYIDNQREAKKVFVEELTGTLYTIAKDVKIQVEFNPAHVGSYRLIGYENRQLAAEDFNDDTKDAGEIGAGHTVTALYEIIPADKMPAVAQDIDRLKYQPVKEPKEGETSPEMLTLKLRFKQPEEAVSEKREYPVKAPGKQRSAPSVQTEWQAAVAAFGMVLRGSKHQGDADLRLVKELAMGSRGPDRSGRRREFINLVLTAERLAAGQPLQSAKRPETPPADEAKKAAGVKGKYQDLLKTISIPDDLSIYGDFNDYGYWEGETYRDHTDLPKAHWVYVYPNWYLWGKTTDGQDQE